VCLWHGTTRIIPRAVSTCSLANEKRESCPAADAQPKAGATFWRLSGGMVSRLARRTARGSTRCRAFSRRSLFALALALRSQRATPSRLRSICASWAASRKKIARPRDWSSSETHGSWRQRKGFGNLEGPSDLPRRLGCRQTLNFEPSYWSALLPDIERFLASLRSSIVSSMIVAGTKLGGNERGGNSLKVATNWKTSSIAP
jgi:hypothetical protein